MGPVRAGGDPWVSRPSGGRRRRDSGMRGGSLLLRRLLETLVGALVVGRAHVASLGAALVVTAVFVVALGCPKGGRIASVGSAGGHVEASAGTANGENGRRAAPAAKATVRANETADGGRGQLAAPGAPVHATEHHRLTSTISLVVASEKATLVSADGALSNPKLIRLPTKTHACVSDGLLGVEARVKVWAIEQVHCAGDLILSEKLVFSLPTPGHPARLVGFNVTCINRFAPAQDGLEYEVPASELGDLLFEEVVLSSLYDKLDLSSCEDLDRAPR